MSEKTFQIPLVKCLINRIGQTTSVARVPEYEALILQEIWSGVDKVDFKIVPFKPNEQVYIAREKDVEKSRLASMYKRDPNDKNALLFSRVFPGSSFDQAFDQVVNGKQASAGPQMGLATGAVQAEDDAAPPVPAPERSPLCAIKGVDDDIAAEIENDLGVYTVEEFASMDPKDLEKVTGIGPKTAPRMLESAQEIVLASGQVE